MRRFFHLILAALVGVALSSAADAKPAATQSVKEVQYMDPLYPKAAFNGLIRLEPKYFGPARSTDDIAERPADPDVRILVFDALLTDVHSAHYTDDPNIRLVDTDGVSADTRTVQPDQITLQEGSTTRLHVVFWAPKDFVPDRIVFSCESTKCKTMRIHFKR